KIEPPLRTSAANKIEPPLRTSKSMPTKKIKTSKPAPPKASSPAVDMFAMFGPKKTTSDKKTAAAPESKPRRPVGRPKKSTTPKASGAAVVISSSRSSRSSSSTTTKTTSSSSTTTKTSSSSSYSTSKKSLPRRSIPPPPSSSVPDTITGFHTINQLGYLALPPSRGLPSPEFSKGWEKFLMYKPIAFLWSDGWNLGQLCPLNLKKGKTGKATKSSGYAKTQKKLGANFWVKYGKQFYLQKISPESYLNEAGHPDDANVGSWCLLAHVNNKR
ncbi:hypothetical protein TrRE_jg2010, partial [Triparma retinervis]